MTQVNPRADWRAIVRGPNENGRPRAPASSLRNGNRQMTESTHSLILFFGIAPIRLAATCPPLNSISAGIERTL